MARLSSAVHTGLGLASMAAQQHMTGLDGALPQHIWPVVSLHFMVAAACKEVSRLQPPTEPDVALVTATMQSAAVLLVGCFLCLMPLRGGGGASSSAGGGDDSSSNASTDEELLQRLGIAAHVVSMSAAVLPAPLMPPFKPAAAKAMTQPAVRPSLAARRGVAAAAHHADSRC